LGKLMSDSEKAASPLGSISAESDAVQPAAGPGVGSLLRGTRSDEKNVFAEPPSVEAQIFEVAAKKPLIPPWYFFAADLLLIAFALVVFYKSRSPLSGTAAFLCITSIVLAGILGAIGVWLGRKSDS